MTQVLCALHHAGEDKSREGEASMFAPRFRKGVIIGILLFAIQQVRKGVIT